MWPHHWRAKSKRGKERLDTEHRATDAESRRLQPQGARHRRRASCAARREHCREVGAVLARGVDVERRREVRRPHGVRHSLRRVGRDDQRHRVDAAERDAHGAVHRGGGVGDARPVGAERDRGEAVLLAGRDGDPRQQLARPGRGQVDAEEELLRGNFALAAGAGDRHPRADRDHQRRQVVRRVVRADVAADRAAIPHLHVGDRRADLAEDRPRLRLRRGHELGVRRHRADRQRPVGCELDPAQLVEPVEVDEHVGRRRARLHDVDQRLPAGERAGAVVRREQLQRFRHGPRFGVFDLAQQHESDPIERRECGFSRPAGGRRRGPRAPRGSRRGSRPPSRRACPRRCRAPTARRCGRARRRSCPRRAAGRAGAPGCDASRSSRRRTRRSASAPRIIGRSNLSSCVRTTTAVPRSGWACASASSGQRSRSSSALGIRSGVAKARPRVGDDRPPAEELRRATESLRRVDRAVDEEPRRRRHDVREDRAVLQLDDVTAAPPARRLLELRIVEPLADSLAGDDRERHLRPLRPR